MSQPKNLALVGLRNEWKKHLYSADRKLDELLGQRGAVLGTLGMVYLVNLVGRQKIQPAVPSLFSRN